MQTLLQDLRYGARMLFKQPGFTLIAVFTLALGIGATTAIFGLFDKLLLRKLPVTRPDELVTIKAESFNPKFTHSIFSWPDYQDYRAQNQVFAGLIAHNTLRAQLGAAAPRAKVATELVSGDYFELLGVKPQLGRLLASADNERAGAHPIAVISHAAWRKQFASDAAIVGREIILNDHKFTVVGVAARGFSGLVMDWPTEVWLPALMRQQVKGDAGSIQQRDDQWLRLVGRLKPGVTQAQAQLSLDLLAKQIRDANTAPANRQLPFYEKQMLLETAARGTSGLRKDLGAKVKLVMALVGLLLLSSCANVTTLLLIRAHTRRKELAIRRALGAGRWRLTRQLLTESLLLAVAGTITGVWLAPWLTSVLRFYQPDLETLENAFDQSTDWRMLLFTVLLTLGCGVAAGLIPAWQSTRGALLPVLKEDGGSLFSGIKNRWQRWLNARQMLTVAQIAFATIVLVCAGLLARSLRNLFAVEAGYATENVLLVPVTFPVAPDLETYDKARQQQERDRMQGQLLQMAERLRALPGVSHATFAMAMPLSSSEASSSLTFENRAPQSGEQLAFDMNKAGPGFHETLGIPLVAGRGFSAQDTVTDGAVVINETMARLFFPNQNPVGQRVRRGKGNYWLEIIGVARDVKWHSLTGEAQPHFDLLTRHAPLMGFGNFLVRTTVPPPTLAAAARQAVLSVAPEAEIARINTLSEQLAESIAPERMAASLTSLFGLITLLSAGLGLYSVMAYAVSQRTRELGIRVALGASVPDILRLVMRDGLWLLLMGLAGGIGAALWLTPWLAHQLYGVTPRDPWTTLGVALLLACVALLACWIPARRATKVDPMIALRCE